MVRSFARRMKTLLKETFPPCSLPLTPPSHGMFLAIVRSPGITWGHDQIGGFFQRTMALSGGAFSIDVHNVLADGDLVVVLATVNAQRNGVAASFSEVHVWRLKNRKATEFREYQGDEQGEDRFWS